MTLSATQSLGRNNKKWAVASAFSRAAHHYDRHAAFQREVGDRLMAKLPVDLSGLHILDLGCGTGYFSSLLRERGAHVVCVDLAKEMLAQAQKRCGCDEMTYCEADAEALPFPENSFDYVFSSLALQWCDELYRPLKEIRRVLKNNGKGFFSTLVDGSLYELSQAWASVDAYQHINQFLSVNAVKVALAQADISEVTLEFDSITVWYDTAMGLMKDLKGIGANHVPGRANRTISKQVLSQVEESYQCFRDPNGLLPATYQVCLGVILR
ncbi:malonyl-ACP O-methyltransferase BioC [Vibrio tritonius]|uniref:Malonyl-[acyl-carrier protein] O-methyltransferase n=1 Tax=Vibrio tritonius TaxID=1435069 RepID=A0ABS7YMF1_9VIBR|nr:malonyl-ACP O-methyltransferase BioC [Vibrio tritonius]MCA2016528.1 malonyl-ACP O-methyltransferase BioC [Vibrio tritonius]